MLNECIPVLCAYGACVRSGECVFSRTCYNSKVGKHFTQAVDLVGLWLVLLA